MRELVVFVADASMEAAFKAFMSRPKFHERICCGYFEFDPSEDIRRNPQDTDPGLLKHAHTRLSKYKPGYAKAIVILDAAFETTLSAPEIAERIETNLVLSGWDKSCVKAIVIEPELESWIFTGSPHVEDVLGFEKGTLQPWLADAGEWDSQEPKPKDPKGAIERALRHQGKTPSPAHYSKILKKSSIRNCTDAAFLELKRTLQSWFPAG